MKAGDNPHNTDMFTASNVSVIIPSYNSCSRIESCLDALLDQTTPPLEIIVVDSSADGTANLITKKYPAVQLRKVKYRIFPGPARNLGVKAARGSIIAFTDADCIAAPDWVERIVADHNAGRLAVGGAIEVGNPNSGVAWAGHLGEFREFLPAGDPRPVIHVPTCNISYRKDLFEVHGGFPDAYYPQEDLLFNYLLGLQGLQIWFDPAVRVRHFCREDMRSYLSHQHRIGRVTRCTLRRINLPGSRIARMSKLGLLASPALGLLKFVRTAGIFVARYPRQVWRQPGLFLLLALGAIWWARGFAEGARTGLSGIRGWTDPDEPIFNLLVPARERQEFK